jgi:hypothetical protein
MDFEAVVISHALRGNIGKILDASITEELFVSNKELWIYVKDTYLEHGNVPPLELVLQKFPDYREPASDVPITLASEELRKRRAHNILIKSLKKQADFMKSGDPFSAVSIMRETLSVLDNVDKPALDVNLADNPMRRKEEYCEVDNRVGIPTPWECFNQITFGFQPEDLIMIAGRSGVGKTWGETVIACHQWKMGYIPLVFSREMSVRQIIRRIDAMNSKLPYQRFRAGMLSGEELERWEKSLRDMKDGIPFWVSGDNADLGVTGIRAKIRKYKPHMVWIDGAYLLRDELNARQQWERWANICWGLKRAAQLEQIPIGISHQFSLEGKDDKGNADTLKYGDVKMWFDLILGMYQDDAMKASAEMLFKILKQREGPLLNWVCKWDLQDMLFDTKVAGADDVGRGNADISDGSGIADPSVEY